MSERVRVGLFKCRKKKSENVTQRCTRITNVSVAFQVYIGGLELNKRANALAVGMKSADKSFKGCLRSMEADGKLLGFPNAKVTQGVLPNCVWSYACSNNPCDGGATCSQYGVDSFHCECDKSPCTGSDPAAKHKVDNSHNLL